MQQSETQNRLAFATKQIASISRLCRFFVTKKEAKGFRRSFSFIFFTQKNIVPMDGRGGKKVGILNAKVDSMPLHDFI